jgi:hypothetical protein
VRQILEALKASPRINRKELAEKVIGPETEVAEAEKTKLALASDLHWMIREGHVIEFNDGSLDLPRAKPPKKEAGEAATEEPAPATTATAETPPAETVLDTPSEASVVAAAVAGGSADVPSGNPSQTDNANPARTEGSRGQPSDGTSSEVLSLVIPSREDNARPARTEGPHERPNAPDLL